MIKIDRHISELLFEHDCVIVPELGGFLASYQPSEIHPVQHTFSPPSKKIAFNAVLKQNDGLLASYVSQTESFTYNKAMQEIKGYVDDCLHRLSDGNKVAIEQIGTLYKNAEGSLQFEPSKSLNHLKDSFGLVSIQFLPAEQLQQKENRKILRESVKLPKQKTVKVSRKKIVNTVLIAAGAIWFCFNVYVISPSRFSVSSLSPVPESVKVETPVKSERVITEPKATENNIASTEVTPAEKVSATTETSTEAKAIVPETKQQIIPETNNSENKFFLIGGAFRSAQNAVKFSEELKATGFTDAHILNEQASLKMVCYSGFPTLEEAQAERSRLKSMQKEAWIYRD